LKRDLVQYLELPRSPRLPAASLGQAIFAIGVERFATDLFSFLIDSGSLRYRKTCDMSLRYGIIDDLQDCHCTADKYGICFDSNPNGMWISRDEYVARYRAQTDNGLDSDTVRARISSIVEYRANPSNKLEFNDIINKAHQRVRVIHSSGAQDDEDDESYADAVDLDMSSTSRPTKEAKIIFCGNCKAFLSIKS